MAPATNILITGLSMEYTKSILPDMDTDKFGKALEASMSKLGGVQNLNYHIFYLEPSAADDSPRSVASLQKMMREGPPSGGQWNGHLFGGGVRKIDPLTVLFEDMINMAIQTSGGKAKLLFSVAGTDHWEVVKRGFPELGMGDAPA